MVYRMNAVPVLGGGVFSYQFYLSKSSESKIDCKGLLRYNRDIKDKEGVPMKVLAISAAPARAAIPMCCATNF